eukprot:TRINITY_DN4450_c0_g1_i4.p1 TRINITY_DN4450_c0_g1~~TRINITY_DN4450_c0_g1_i4.p1  ORF type:complete len:248 (-),score=57.59 TRINITY_DN4450_c0_g1_i4:95-838(-)
MDPSNSANSANQYLTEHGIFQLFESLMARLVIEKPKDPLSFLINQLQPSSLKKVILLGCPGSDKDLVCSQISKRYGLTHISTKQIISDTIRTGGEIGKKISQYVESGQLVPDDLVIPLVVKKMSSLSSQGWVLEGFPRTKYQAFTLQEAGFYPDLVVYLNMTLESALKKQANSKSHNISADKLTHKYSQFDLDKNLVGLQDVYNNNILLLDGTKSDSQLTAELATSLEKLGAKTPSSSKTNGHSEGM